MLFSPAPWTAESSFGHPFIHSVIHSSNMCSAAPLNLKAPLSLSSSSPVVDTGQREEQDSPGTRAAPHAARSKAHELGMLLGGRQVMWETRGWPGLWCREGQLPVDFRAGSTDGQHWVSPGLPEGTGTRTGGYCGRRVRAQAKEPKTQLEREAAGGGAPAPSPVAAESTGGLPSGDHRPELFQKGQL